MKKISTLYKKDPNDFSKVINEVNPENEWVFDNGIPTRKFDGTSCAVLWGHLYKRYDAKIYKKKRGKIVKTYTIEQIRNMLPKPHFACQQPDLITGHYPHWIPCDISKPEDKYHFEAFNKQEKWEHGTYELCGEKIQGNPENIVGHELIKHGSVVLNITDFSFESLREYLSNPQNDIEGIVFHEKDGDRMCKIRKSDFGIKR